MGEMNSTKVATMIVARTATTLLEAEKWYKAEKKTIPTERLKLTRNIANEPSRVFEVETLHLVFPYLSPMMEAVESP